MPLDVDEHRRAGRQEDVAEAQVGGGEAPEAKRRGRMLGGDVADEVGVVGRLGAVQEAGDEETDGMFANHGPTTPSELPGGST